MDNLILGPDETLGGAENRSATVDNLILGPDEALGAENGSVTVDNLILGPDEALGAENGMDSANTETGTIIPARIKISILIMARGKKLSAQLGFGSGRGEILFYNMDKLFF